MRSKKKLTVMALLLGAAGALSNVAQAVPISCPGSGNVFDREFVVNTALAAGCVAYGNGNFENVATGEAAYLADAWSTIDKTDGNGGTMNGVLSVSNLDNDHGNFWIDASVWGAYADVLFVMKSGQGQYNPDWAVFSLANGTTSGSWSILTLFDNADGLSHVNLYGRSTPTSVPEPATFALFGTGLFGLALMRRRRMKTIA
jgi:hypothetical protein